jgi:gliding motility-associated-like protein
MFKKCLFGVLLLFVNSVFSQCINTFPYIENFEVSQGNWNSGGIGNDWAWGAPSKPVITAAGSGTKCWIVGGLTASFYNYSERSYIESPCFDFTNIQNPFVSFKIFWELEKTYDGATFQYSTDGGNTWANVGSSADATNCLNENWFNTASVTNLSSLATPREGWTGNIQSTSGSCQGGSGSGTWRLAKHCMPYLAGSPNVVFRFAFGAGSTCNSYDGFAFDSISIGEAPVNTADFSYTCNGNAFSFTALTTLCPDNLRWNFGDAASSSNIANGSTVSHTFSGAGVYNVTLDVSGPCNAPASVTKSISIIGVSASSFPASCSGTDDGQAFVTVSNASGSLTYIWNTTPVQTTDTAFNLPAGNYTVTVTPSTGCSLTQSVVVNGTVYPMVRVNTTADFCGSLGGTANAVAAGGTLPYSYSWSTGTISSSQIAALPAASYSITITDAKNCTASAVFTIEFTSGINVSANTKDVSCFMNNDGEINVIVAGGQLPYSYSWSSSGTIDSVLKNLATGSYSVTVTDANFCSSSASFIVGKTQCESYVTFPTAFTPNGDGLNDLFKPKYSPDLKSYNLKIYNRWGELVFETSNARDGWDGMFRNQEQPISTFAWFCEYGFIDGSKQISSGNVTLVR